MNEFEQEFNRKHPKKNSNLKFANWSVNATWSGASFFRMRMRALNDLVKLRNENIWPWDYAITLSEADFPLK